MTIEQNSWVNPEKVSFFSLDEFVDKIRLEQRTLDCLDATSYNFNDYIKFLKNIYHDDLEELIIAWLDQGIREQIYSNKIENHIVYFKDLSKANLFFEKRTISHERIKRIHNFVCTNGDVHSSIVGDYRKTPATVGTFIDNKYLLYWNGAEASDVKKFMDSFISFYTTNNIKFIYSNPFLKAALAHLLFVRIHPFGDGNGRSARIIQNIAFTDGINQIYKSKLTLSPINVSQCIAKSKFDYVDILNRIHFNLDYDNNELINRWFRYMLFKYDEAMNYQSSRFRSIEGEYKRVLAEAGDASKQSADKMKVKKLFGNTH